MNNTRHAHAARKDLAITLKKLLGLRHELVISAHPLDLGRVCNSVDPVSKQRHAVDLDDVLQHATVGFDRFP